MMRLDFDQEKHEYRLDGELIPSVSELLKPITEDHYGAINPAVLAQAAARGTEVHEATESIDYGLDPEDISLDIFPYLDAYCAFLRDYKPEWYGIEDMVYGGVADIHGSFDYAGTIDRWGMIDGTMAVVDIKTVAQPSPVQKITTAIQTYLYSCALCFCGKQQQKPTRRYALYLKKDGTYDLLDLDDYACKAGISLDRMVENLTCIWACKREIREEINKTKRGKNDGKNTTK